MGFVLFSVVGRLGVSGVDGYIGVSLSPVVNGAVAGENIVFMNDMVSSNEVSGGVGKRAF